MLLAAVNFFLGVVGIIQVSRILLYRSSQSNQTVVDEVKEGVESAKDAVKST